MKKTILIILVLAVSIGAKSQVTIGSNKKTLEGALLELNNGPAINSSTSTKGVGLPRVQLQAIDKLQMSSNDSEISEKEEHVGLLVYHMRKTEDICDRMPSGTYIWDGERWVPLGFEIPERPKLELPVTQKTGLDQPNSYIVSQSSVVKIPIDKAIAVWDGVSWLGDEADAGVPQGYSTYPLLPQKNLNNLTAELLWTDNRCLILNQENLEIKNGYIEVWVDDRKGKGNAVVALKNNDEVVWSWHIWGTDQPEINIHNGKRWLDRNIGASSATPMDANSIGCHFQWGRKDPFVPPVYWNSTVQKLSYNGKGGSVQVTGSSVTANPTANLTKSINHPLVFITSSGNGYDWYSNTTQGRRWINRWSANPDSKKSPSDPCPEGWRIPVGTGAPTYPWAHPNPPVSLVKTPEMVYQNGWVIPEFGYFPVAGSRSVTTGAFATNSPNNWGGYFWHAHVNNNSSYPAYVSGISPALMYDASATHKAYGFSVRCFEE